MPTGTGTSDEGTPPFISTGKWAPVPRSYRFVFCRSPRTPPSSYGTPRGLVGFKAHMKGTWKSDRENILYWCYEHVGSRARARIREADTD